MKDKPISVCHIIFKLDYGGLENGLVNLINKLPADTFRHSIVCLKNATGFRKRIRRDDVEIHEINKRDGKDPSSYYRVWKLVRQIQPDIVHTRNIATVDMQFPAFLAGVRNSIHSEHGLDVSEIGGKNRKYNALRRLSNLTVKYYIAVSRDIESWLINEIGIPAGKTGLVYNGVDTDVYAPHENRVEAGWPEGFAGRDAFVIGAIGRMTPIKGHMLLARAFAEVLARRPELRPSLRLVIAGDGPEYSAVRAFLGDRGIEKTAWLPGFRDDTVELYNAFDVFALPSLREGISNTALEAMSCGRAVIAAETGGNPEIIRHNATGLLTSDADPGLLADCILHYVDNPGVLQQHGNAARRHVLENFSLKCMVENYSRIYRELAGG